MPILDTKTKGASLAKIRGAANFILRKTKLRPESAVILGTGLAGITDHLKIEFSLPYSEIPGFPVPTVEGHTGMFHIGRVKTHKGLGRFYERVDIAILEGRFHLYEGYSPIEIAMPVRVLKGLGIKNLILTNASGGLNPLFKGGEIMIIKDHINLTGQNPLLGRNLDEIGPRFPDMTRAYDKGLMEIAEHEAKKLGIRFNHGIYVGILGPSLETPAETRMLRLLGADAVGMSTVMEVIAAVHAGLRVLGLSVISNVNHPDEMKPILLEEIIAAAKKAGPDLISLIGKILLKIHRKKG
jgi:purine-nucleoside phosphorylase